MVFGEFRGGAVVTTIQFLSFVIAVMLLPTLEEWLMTVEALEGGLLLKFATWVAAYILAFHILPWVLERAHLILFEG